ncbi:dUTPase [Staphylococcus sp. IVB6181]|uniref:dUTPase n=1 Tax=Staphylococcus sp. IVB6181 TaxID=2929481 RepID=UPI0021D2302F|nr:dUTPase [Staphylococcus sp. IVB6181]UXV34506.1 dUTPase [Staphylococcus sp. IVB6181]
MTNTITVEQLKELLQIQKEFDDRIPTLNLEDSKVAYIVEFFEWFNTLETFKNWKKKPGKPLDVQLDELADLLAFGLSIVNQSCNEDEKEELVDNLYFWIQKREKGGKFDLSKKDNTLTIVKLLPLMILSDSDESVLDAVTSPFGYAKNYYSINQLGEAYKKKMQRNHDRQDGKADKDKGYV